MGSSATTSGSSGLSSDFAPYLQQYGSMIQGVANAPYQSFSGPRVANLSPLQNGALSGYGAVAGAAAPAFSGAAGMLSDTLSGNGGNQFTDQVVNRATQGAKDQFASQVGGIRRNFNSAGGWGSDRQNLALDRTEKNLATGLADSTGALYSNAYESERNRQMQSAGMLPGLLSGATGALGSALQAGNVSRAQDQSVIDANYGDWREANNYPSDQLSRVSSAIGPLFGAAPRQTTSTGPGADPVGQSLGIMALGNQMSQGKNSGGSGITPWSDGSAYMVQ